LFLDNIGPNDPIVIEDEDFRQGRMLYVTAAAKLTLPFWALPSFSVVVRNATDQEFNKYSKVNEGPEKINKTMDLAFSITPMRSQVGRVHFEVNYRDVGREYEEIPTKNRLMAGLEFDYARKMFVRMGYGDGYGTFGLGVRSRTVIVDLATYAVNTTHGTFKDKEDRRFALSISSGL